MPVRALVWQSVPCNAQHCVGRRPITLGAQIEIYPKETLNKSSAAERRIFCLIRSVLKTGNTYSIPSFLELSAKSKSSAVSSCRFNQSFPNSCVKPIFTNFKIISEGNTSILHFAFSIQHSSPAACRLNPISRKEIPASPGKGPAGIRNSSENQLTLVTILGIRAISREAMAVRMSSGIM